VTIPKTQRAVDSYRQIWRRMQVKRKFWLILGVNNYPPWKDTVYISPQQETVLR
jgi:hypothetical protein